MADAPDAPLGMWLGLPPIIAPTPLLVLFAERSPTGKLSRDLSIVTMATLRLSFFHS
jgi:hypothetical protein